MNIRSLLLATMLLASPCLYASEIERGEQDRLALIKQGASYAVCKQFDKAEKSGQLPEILRYDFYTKNGEFLGFAWLKPSEYGPISIIDYNSNAPQPVRYTIRNVKNGIIWSFFDSSNNKIGNLVYNERTRTLSQPNNPYYQFESTLTIPETYPLDNLLATGARVLSLDLSNMQNEQKKDFDENVPGERAERGRPGTFFELVAECTIS